MLGIVTDSVACLPAELVERYGIRVVPVRIVRGERVYRDGVDVSVEEAFEWLAAGKIVTTSQPAVGEFVEVYETLSRTVERIVSIHVSSGVTGVYQAAVAAAGMVTRVPITVIDSNAATMAEGFLILEAARCVERGADLRSVVQRVEELRPRLRFFAVLETVSFLVRSGRAPWLAKLAVDLLKVKPILTLQGGKIVSLKRVRTQKRAIDAMLRRMERDVGDRPLHVAVLHAGTPSAAEAFAHKIAQRFRTVEQSVTSFSPAMALYTGPGLLGLVYYADDAP